MDKKVLLRERKRHTNRGISSTPYAVLFGEVSTLDGGRYLGVPLPLGTWQGVGTLDGGRYLEVPPLPIQPGQG